MYAFVEKMLKTEKWIEYCHYCKGESENPFTGTDKELLWCYEYKWVEWNVNKKRNSLVNFLEDYIRCGLTDFSKFDDTPSH